MRIRTGTDLAIAVGAVLLIAAVVVIGKAVVDMVIGMARVLS